MLRLMPSPCTAWEAHQRKHYQRHRPAGVAAGRFTGSPYICFVSSRFFLKLIHWYNSFFGPSSVDPERGLQQNKLFHGMMDFTSFSQSCFCGSNSPNWLWIIPWFGIKPHFIYGTSVWPLRGSCQMVPIPLRGLSSWIHGRSLNTDSHGIVISQFHIPWQTQVGSQ